MTPDAVVAQYRELIAEPLSAVVGRWKERHPGSRAIRRSPRCTTRSASASRARCRWKESLDQVDALGLKAEARRKLICDNARELFRL